MKNFSCYFVFFWYILSPEYAISFTLVPLQDRVSDCRLATTCHHPQALLASHQSEDGGESKTPRHLVIVGGGIGGLSSAYDAHHMIKSHRLEITVVSDRDDFSFTPSNPWVATRIRTPSEISVSLKEVLPLHGIKFINGNAEKLDAKEKVLFLEGGTKLSYDYLIASTGPRLALEEIPGLSTASNAHSVCTTPHASKAADAVDELMKNPRPFVIGATQGASCFGPAYEFCLLLNHEMKRRGGQELLDKCAPITFVTPEPYLGHMGLDGAGESRCIMTDLLLKYNIKTLVNTRIKLVTSDAVHVELLDDNGEVSDVKVLPSAFTMLIPPFRGQDVWKSAKGLATDKGLVLVNEFQQSLAYPEIFGVGTCVDIPAHEESVIPIGSPKTGYLIESMGTAAVRNIKTMMDWEDQKEEDRKDPAPVLKSKALMNGLCITDFGDDGAVFVTMPQIRPRRHDWTLHGKAATLAKIAFEKYFLHKIKSGDTDPYYEKYMLKLIGVERTKEEA